MIVTIGGTPGSGKSVIADRISKKLSWEYIDIGGLRRAAAGEKGMALEQFNEWSEKNPALGDKYFDDFVKGKVQKMRNAVIVGRLGYFLFPQSLKIILTVDIDEGVRRIFEHKKQENSRNETLAHDLAEQKKLMVGRMNSDILRYKNLYNTNCYDPSNFDVVIDTTSLTIDEVEMRVLSAIQDAKKP